MHRFMLAIALALFGTVFTAPPDQAVARDLKMDCPHVTFTANFYRDDSGYVYYMNEPKVKKIECNGDVNDVYALEGYPGSDSFTSTKDIKAKIDAIRYVLDSGMLKGLTPAQYPPAIKFVHDLVQEAAAAEKKHRAAQVGKSPGLLDQKH